MSTNGTCRWFAAITLVLLLSLIQGGCQPILVAPAPVEPTATPLPDRILFIGDSFTFWNQGIDSHIEALAASANPPLTIEASNVTIGGAPLARLWQYGRSLDEIREGNWDVVVLQEDLAMGTDEQKFYEYARKFDEEITNADAQTVLYMTWEWDREYAGVTTEDIVRAYSSIGSELGVPVAPVGIAWERAMEERPDLYLFDDDRVHPNMLGTYLITSVLYATLFGQSPEGLSYLPGEMEEDAAAFLQRIAWETVKEYEQER